MARTLSLLALDCAQPFSGALKFKGAIEDWGCSKEVALRRMQHYRPKGEIKLIPELQAHKGN